MAKAKTVAEKLEAIRTDLRKQLERANELQAQRWDSDMGEATWKIAKACDELGIAIAWLERAQRLSPTRAAREDERAPE